MTLPIVAFDTETELFTETVLAPPLVCATWATDIASGIFKWDGENAGAAPETIFRAWLQETTLVGHNVPYDMAVLAAAWVDLFPDIFKAYAQGRVKDTLTRDKLIGIAYGQFRWKKDANGDNERVNYSLADLAFRHLGVRLQKGEDQWRKHYAGLMHVPLVAEPTDRAHMVEHPDGVVRPIRQWPTDAVHYAVNDATSTRACYVKQEAKRAAVWAEHGIDLLADEDRQARAAFWLHLAYCWGMRVAPDKRDALRRAVEAEIEIARQMLLDEGLLRVETYKRDRPALGIKAGQVKKYTRDTKAAAAYMIRVCDENGIEVRRTKKAREALANGAHYDGGIALDEESCKETADPFLAAYADYTALANVLGKDVKAMMLGEIHGRFDSLVETGRTSCRGFNLQNLRRKGGTRECFTPRDGYVYCTIDLDTAELRAVAQICLKMFGHSRLAEVINGGKDAHCYLTAEAIGMPYEEVKALHDADDPRISDERQLYKSANFGLWGGMGETRFGNLIRSAMRRSVYETSSEVERAKIRGRLALVSGERVAAVRNAWLATWPEAPEYLAYFARLCADGRECTIEQIFSGRYRGGLRYSQAANTGFQGLVADAAKDAGWVLSRAMYDVTRESILYGSRIVNFPHDEFICEVPEEIGHECAQEIQRIVIERVSLWLPDVPPKATPVLARYWSKKAKPVFIDGRLVPWGDETKERAA